MAPGHRRFFGSLNPIPRRSIWAGVAVVGLVALSLVSGNRGGSATPENQAAHSSEGYFEAAPTITTQTSLVPGATVAPDPKGAPQTPVKQVTTAPPPSECGGDKHAGFGCPVIVDNFDGNAFNTGVQGWAVYDYPDSNFPRVATNARVADGMAQLDGTYDRATGTILGAGLASQLSQKYGRWEVRMRVESGRGWSAAGLLWPTSERWPTDGEIDLFEIPAAQRQRLSMTVHNGIRNNTGDSKVVMDATQWHTYAVEWTPTKLTYYIDGQVKWTVVKPALVPSTGDLHMTLQMDPGTKQQCGGWFECPDASTPAKSTMYVDYAKMWLYRS